MAIRAHLDQPDPAPGQRAAPRRALRLETSGYAAAGPANVIVHNLSAIGLLLETDMVLSEGEELALELPEAGVVSAIVVWRSERLYGCAFAAALPPAALAAAQLRAAAPRPPAAALPAAAPVDALPARLNALRRKAGLTLADVATALGVSKPTVWAWEKGKARPLPERLPAIAAALGVAPEELAPAAHSRDDAASVIAACRARIAEACGTAPAAVKIMLEL